MPDIDVFYQDMGELPEYDTILFRQVWPTMEDFQNDYEDNPLKWPELDGKQSMIYYLLFANYANNPIANYDVDQFKAKVFEKIFNHAPTWQKNLQIQERLRSMSEEELRVGGKNVSNFAVNPNTSPSTSSTEELSYVSQQTSRNHKKGRMDAYANLMALLDEDVTERFIERFRPLFRRFVRPSVTAIYPNEEEE